MDELGFRVQDAYCEDLCPVIINKVRRYYADQGFYNANAELKQEQLEDGKLRITVAITEGEPTYVSSVSFESEGIMNSQDLQDMIGIKKGDRVRYSYLQDRLKRLKEYLFNSSCYSASIYRNSIKVSKDAKTASVEVGVKTGPKFDIVFRGNDTFPNPQTLKKVMDITSTDVVSRDYYPVLVKKIEDFYYSMGFVDPKVTVTEALSEKAWELRLIFNIIEGPKKYFGNVRYNVQRAPMYVSMLRTYVEEKKPDLFERGFFVRKEFEDIRKVIEDFFAEHGFLRARVVSVNFKDVSKNKIDVNYEIDAGSETLIRDIRISGNTVFTSKEIISRLELTENTGLKVRNFNTKINELIDTYKQLGYADAYIDKASIVSYSEDYRLTDIHVHIYEGSKYRIGKIFIEGLVKTKGRVVTREFEFEEDGKVLTYELQETENKLAGLGLFGSVSVMQLPGSVKGPGYKDILVKVEEKKSGTYEVGFGYRTDDGIRVSSGVTYGNLGGWNRRINLNAAVARRLDNQYRFIQYEVASGYYEPYFWNLPLDFRVTVDYKKEDLTDYGKKSLNLSFYFEKTIGYNTFILTNSFQRINVFDAPVLADNNTYWKYSIRQTYRLDTRDSFFSPNKGLYFNVYGEWGRSFKSSAIANYVKVVEQARLYIPILKSWTIVPSFNSGYVKGLKGDSILLDERFSLGGMDNIRGYREGIINDLTPNIGSQYFYSSSIEIRRKLFWRFVGIAFHDIGNISSEDPTLNGPFSSVGGGISLRLPVGSLSLQYGYIYKLDKRIPPDKIGRLHFSIGTF